jgi:hypothetical protein
MLVPRFFRPAFGNPIMQLRIFRHDLAQFFGIFLEIAAGFVDSGG